MGDPLVLNEPPIPIFDGYGVNSDKDFVLLRCRLFAFSDFQRLLGAVLIIEKRFHVVLSTFDMGQLRVG